MKILAIGDLHGDTSLAKELAKKADDENVDLVLICGDVTHNDGSAEHLLGAFNKKIAFVPGNHDSLATADFLAERYDAKNLHGYSIKVGEVGFFGCSAVNCGLFQLNDTEIKDMLRQGFNYLKDSKKKIMLTHTHPSESLAEKFSNLVPGSDAVKDAINEFKPDILLCSHVHEAEGVEQKIGNTTVINVGKKGKIIEL
ncbi:MAG: metallophosphoesterase [archaeon]